MKAQPMRYVGFVAVLCLGTVTVLLWPAAFSEEDQHKIMSHEQSTSSESKSRIVGPGKNRLASEKSPYLLQHAANPVDWHPWSEEAFLKARNENKPIFLSIGYSSCHWCHVMEEESFEDEEVARILNEHFVAIKVDREERPDVDHIYMSVCLSMTGSGGWPLTVVMTPDQKPFFAGTYFPKHSKYGRPGLLDILTQIVSLWETKKNRVLKAADEITQSIQRSSTASPAGDLTENTLRDAYQELANRFDRTHGGFGSAPKFPSAHTLSFLLRWWKRSGDAEALRMVEETLRGMARGGLYDHLGFGFHRYSTDARWLVPHFEKMLYDQAMLAIAYSEAYQATRKPQYAEVAEGIFEYVRRELTSPDGAFYSAEDADSEGEEGKFYVWSYEEVESILGKENGDLFCRFFGITKEGNFEKGKNVLHAQRAVDEFVAELNTSVEVFRPVLESARRELFRSREKRVHPFKDDKILTDWNGLMIAALAKGTQALGKPEHADAARRAADFLLKRLRDENGRLLHRYREGEAAVLGYLDDYAFLVFGLIELYEATFEVNYLKEALSLTKDMLELFWDEDRSGFYFSGRDSESLIARTREIHDGAIPSGNSIAALNLLRLGRMTMQDELEGKARALMESFSGTVGRSPSSFAQLLTALDFTLGPTKEIVIAGEMDDRNTQKMLAAVRERFLPGKIIIFHPEDGTGQEIERIVPFVKNQNTVEEKATAYVCENYSCNLPTTVIAEMISLIEAG
jgi:uncharacterized protein YyaL (SSP411 family)